MGAAIYEWTRRGTRVQRFGKRILYNLALTIMSLSVLNSLGVVAHWKWFELAPFESIEFWSVCALIGIGNTLIGVGKPRATRAYPRG